MCSSDLGTMKRAGMTAGLLLVAALSLAAAAVEAPGDHPRGRGDRHERGRDGGQRGGGSASNVFRTEVPPHPYDVVLGRPTGTSITIRVLAYADAEACVAWREPAAESDRATPSLTLRAGVPADIVLDGLKPDTAYTYRLRCRGPGEAKFRDEPGARFHTARAPGNPFVFTITADPHLDDRADPAVYTRTLATAAADAPDFHIDLGDTFMTEKHPGRANAAAQYLAQRYYFSLLCRSAPLFLVLGNHDGEGNRELDGGADSLGVWSTRMRTKYFPNPVPEGFYTGNTRPDPFAGPPQNYYAWEWGDALFVVLDPFRHGQAQRGRDDNWARSLGEAQYRWLAATLAASRARHRLVFIHHLVGGATREGRGGSEAAPFFEWGGRSLDGADDFAARRPGWPMPIAPLLRMHGVGIVFHGHDHLFAKQEHDGIIYQLAPQPGGPATTRMPRGGETTYRDGVLLVGAGYLRVAVSPAEVRVDYVRTAGENPEIAHAYRLPAPSRPR